VGGLLRITLDEDLRHVSGGLLLAQRDSHGATLGRQPAEVDHEHVRRVAGERSQRHHPVGVEDPHVVAGLPQARDVRRRLGRLPVNEDDPRHA